MLNASHVSLGNFGKLFLLAVDDVGDVLSVTHVSLGNFGKLFLLAILYRLNDTLIAFSVTCNKFTC